MFALNVVVPNMFGRQPDLGLNDMMAVCFCRRRVFSALDDHTELHLTILEGIKRRSDTPFFNALIAYSRR
jgi:hypothetical protein